MPTPCELMRAIEPPISPVIDPYGAATKSFFAASLARNFSSSVN